MYGIPSERQIEQRIETDIALRWYLGLDLLERVPDHSTISQLRRRKPGFRRVIRRLFEEVVRQCVEKGLVSGRVAVADSTHVKANASRASKEQVEVAESPGAYWERLDDYEAEGLGTQRADGKTACQTHQADQAGQPADEKACEPDRSGDRANETPRETGGAVLFLPPDSGQ